MKIARRMFCLAIAILMIATVTINAFAATAPAPGEIKITNAEPGKNYDVYKLFDATYVAETGAVSYTTSDATVAAALKADSSPFKVIGDGVSGPYYIELKNEGTNPSQWLKAQVDAGTFGTPVASKSIPSGNIVTFDLPYGYYLVKPGETGNNVAITIDTNTPYVEIVDKNPRTPSEPYKTNDKDPVQVGDTVTYTASFKATNFYTDASDPTKSKIIEEYNVRDTSNALDWGELVSAKYYTTYDPATNTFGGASGNIANVTLKNGTPEGEDDMVKFFNIPWCTTETVDGQTVKTPLYPSPVYVVLTYTMIVNEHIFDDPTYLTADNRIKVKYEYDKKTGEIPGEPGTEVHTIGFSLEKVDAEDNTISLTGAQFLLYTEDNGVRKYYVHDPNTKIISWVEDEAEAEILQPDNDASTIEICGVKPGDYKLEEIKAPDGYRLPAEPFDISVTYDAATEEYSVIFENNTLQPIQGKSLYSLTVENGTGAALPSTGGEGTVVLISSGAVLFLGAVVVLVAKRRTENSEEE